MCSLTHAACEEKPSEGGAAAGATGSAVTSSGSSGGTPIQLD